MNNLIRVASLNYLRRLVSRWKEILVDLISFIGIYWLFVEIASHSTSQLSDSYTKNIRFFLIVLCCLLLLSLYKNKPKTSFFSKLRDKDNFIEIRVGDAFKNPGALVVPVNDCFDMTLNGNVAKAGSVQNTLIKKYYSDKVDHLNADISRFVKIGDKHEIGKTIEIEQSGKSFFLLVNSVRNQNGHVTSNVDDFLGCLNGLWPFIALDSSRHEIVTIPLINTQHGRDSNLSKKSAIKEIISSYVESSKDLDICEKLIISISDSDYRKGLIDLDDIQEFLNYSCKHYRLVIFDRKSPGGADESSRAIGLDY